MLKDAQGNEFTRVYGVVTFYARNRLEFSHQVFRFCFIGGPPGLVTPCASSTPAPERLGKG